MSIDTDKSKTQTTKQAKLADEQLREKARQAEIEAGWEHIRQHGME